MGELTSENGRRIANELLDADYITKELADKIDKIRYLPSSERWLTKEGREAASAMIDDLDNGRPISESNMVKFINAIKQRGG